MLRPRRERRLKRKGYPLTAWTVDGPERIAQLEALGVDAIMTNTVAPTDWPACGAESGAP